MPELVSRLPDIISELRSRFKLIVFDLPVADPLSPCFVFAGLLDGILLIVEQDGVYRGQALNVRGKGDGEARLRYSWCTTDYSNRYQ